MIRPFLSSITNNKNVHHVGVLLRLVRLLVHLGKVRPIVSLHHLLRLHQPLNNRYSHHQIVEQHNRHQ